MTYGSVTGYPFNNDRAAGYGPEPTPDLEVLAAKTVAGIWSAVSNTIATKYVEATDDDDDTSERWREFRRLVAEAIQARASEWLQS
jgi:hypothetical protein